MLLNNHTNRRITLVTRFGWAGISTSVLNTASVWCNSGSSVTIIAIDANITNFPFPDFGTSPITIKAITLSKKSIPSKLSNLLALRALLRKSNLIIAFDVDALLLTGVCTTACSTPIIYHSLEFYEPNKSLKAKLKKLLERKIASKAIATFTQDEHRASYLRDDLRIKSTKIIYNSPSGVASNSPNNHFRRLFNIPKEKTIVLAIGSMLSEHYIPNILDSVPKWDNQFVLILHGWFPDPAIRTYAESISQTNPGKVYISNRLFNNDEKFTPYQASDILILGFLPTNKNTLFAAGSAGKIFDAMRCGKPIVAYSTPGMKEIIHSNNIGNTFTNTKDINRCLNQIMKNYKMYSDSSQKAFAAYEFDNNYLRVLNQLTPHLFKTPLRSGRTE